MSLVGAEAATSMEQLLGNLLMPDNAVIAAATKQLKEVLKNDSQALPELCRVMTAQTVSPQVRQYAALLLR